MKSQQPASLVALTTNKGAITTVAERAFVSLRGFRVAPLSLTEFEDARQSRLLVETEALRLSIAKGDDRREAAIVVALHALRQQARWEGGDLDEWKARRHAFHRALLAACGSGWLLDFFERLYTATERYRGPALIASEPQKLDIDADLSVWPDGGPSS